MNVNTTSSAVKGLPSCHFTLGRSFKVHVWPPSDIVQDVARPRSAASSPFGAVPIR